MLRTIKFWTIVFVLSIFCIINISCKVNVKNELSNDTSTTTEITEKDDDSTTTEIAEKEIITIQEAGAVWEKDTTRTYKYSNIIKCKNKNRYIGKKVNLLYYSDDDCESWYKVGDDQGRITVKDNLGYENPYIMFDPRGYQIITNTGRIITNGVDKNGNYSIIYSDDDGDSWLLHPSFTFHSRWHEFSTDVVYENDSVGFSNLSPKEMSEYTQFILNSIPMGSNYLYVIPSGSYENRILANYSDTYLLYSDDNGITWEKAIGDYIPVFSYVIQLSTGRLVASCKNIEYDTSLFSPKCFSGIWYSDDGGFTWTLSESSVNDSFRITWGQICETKTGRLLAGPDVFGSETRVWGLYYSDDHGETWQRFSFFEKDDTTQCYNSANDYSDYLYPCVACLSSGRIIIKNAYSDDDGETWNLIQPKNTRRDEMLVYKWYYIEEIPMGLGYRVYLQQNTSNFTVYSDTIREYKDYE